MAETLKTVTDHKPGLHIPQRLALELGLGGSIILAAELGYLWYATHKPVVLPPNPSAPELPQIAPTELPGRIRGTLVTNPDAVTDFWRDVEAGKIAPESEAGIDKSYFHGFVLGVNGVNFGLIGTNPAGENKAEWWFKWFDPKTKEATWFLLTETKKLGFNSLGQEEEVTSLMLDGEDLIWFPARLGDLTAALQDPNSPDGIVFKPPTEIGQAIPDYDAQSGKGILIPFSKQGNTDPYSAQSIFEAIEYRGGPNLTPTETPTPIISREKQVMDLAGANFLSTLSRMKESSNPTVASLYDRLFALQTDGAGTVNVSQPIFDMEGNLIRRTSSPMICGYDASGNFIIIVNTPVYVRGVPQPTDLSAAHLDQCLEFQAYMQGKFEQYKAAHPDATLSDAKAANPDWTTEATLHGWFEATKNILNENPDIVPIGESNIYRVLLNAFRKAKGVEAIFDSLLKKVPIGEVSG